MSYEKIELDYGMFLSVSECSGKWVQLPIGMTGRSLDLSSHYVSTSKLVQVKQEGG